jgi:hypothetical protein
VRRRRGPDTAAGSALDENGAAGHVEYHAGDPGRAVGGEEDGGRRDVVGCLRVASVDGDRGARARELGRDGRADAALAAGDQGDLAVQSIHEP